MRIAMFVDTFPAMSETFVLRQITGLMDMGHQVDIFADAAPGDWYPSGDTAPPVEGAHTEVEEYGLLDKTCYLKMPLPSLYENSALPLREKTWIAGLEKPYTNWKRMLQAVPVFLRCARSAGLGVASSTLRFDDYNFHARSLSSLFRLDTLSARVGKYDIIHAQFGPIAARSRFVRKLWNAPLVVNFRGYDFSSWPRVHGNNYYKPLFDEVDAVVTDNDFARQKVVELGCDEDKTHAIPSAFDTSHFQYREHNYRPGEPIRLLTVARLVEKKGLEYAIRAVSSVVDQVPELRYDIIGDGPLLKPLQGLVESLGLSRVVTFHGARDKHFIREQMYSAHIFMLTSVTAENGDQESQGVVLQEAQACGLPVIASRHSGFPESILPGKSGLLVPERDVDAIAIRLRFLIENHDQWQFMGEEGRDYVAKNFNITDLNSRWEGLYRELISRFRARHPRRDSFPRVAYGS